MKHNLAYILILLCFFTTLQLKAEEKNIVIDSLQERLDQADDNEKFDIKIEIGNEYLKFNPEKAKKLAAQYLVDAKKSKDDTKLYKAYILHGSALESTGNYPEAIKDYENALFYATKEQNEQAMGNCYNNLGITNFQIGDYPKSLLLFKKSLRLLENVHDTTTLANVINNIGAIYYQWSNYDEALKYYLKGLKYDSLMQDTSGMAGSFSNIGMVYLKKGSYDIALEYYFKSLKINEKLNNLSKIAINYNNIGILYENQGMMSMAIKFYENSLETRKKIGDKAGLGSSYVNVGGAYAEIGEYEKGLEYSRKGLSIFTSIGHERGINNALNTVGYVHKLMHEYDSALYYFNRSYKLNTKGKVIWGQISDLYNIGEVYVAKNNLDKAIAFQEEALKLAYETQSKAELTYALEVLSESYYIKGNYKKAYDLLSKYFVEADSLLYQDNNEKMLELQAIYETEKKEQEIELLNKDKKIQALSLNKQKQVIIVIIAIAFLIIILAFVLYNRYRIKKQANIRLVQRNIEIEQQKEEIETQRDQIQIQRDTIAESNHAINDSIVYAKRIQQAILPPFDYINEFLQEYMILFMPRDIVSGDFYWMLHKNNRTYVAAADCTGHGVPGAFMSMLGVAFLNEIVGKSTEHPSSSEVLNSLRKQIIRSLHQTGKDGESKDGMDISLCVINQNTHLVNFSGANNPLYLIRNAKNNKLSKKPILESNDLLMYEFKGDKMPIGIHYSIEMKDFSEEIIPYTPQDKIYLFSDGFPDQFGGEEGKKYKYGKFKKLLFKYSALSMNDQKSKLEAEFYNWKKDYDQIDDILIIGIQV